MAEEKQQPHRHQIKKKATVAERVEELTKPDEFVEVGGSLVGSVVSHQRNIAIAVGAVLALLLVLGVTDRMAESKRETAATALFEARRLLPDAGFGAPAADDKAAKVEAAVTALGKVADDYAGTPQGAIAAMEAGSALYRQGRYEDALGWFEKAGKGKGLVRARAKLAQAYALESLGRWNEAIATFDAIRGKAKGDGAEQALLDLARAYEGSGDKVRAVELYKEFESKHGQSLRLPEVKARITALGG